jgi:ParB-like chromosome segregation protein Spo0J
MERQKAESVASIVEAVRDLLSGCQSDQERAEVLNAIRVGISEHSPWEASPVDAVRWVPVSKVSPNDYNPNSVAIAEMKLLVRSILADGYTQPVVTVYDAEKDLYVIVDGFHRYTVAKTCPEVQKLTKGMVPVVVLDKPLADRMAATVRHNRARGRHSVQGMSNLVFQMLSQGMTDEEVCNELGMEPDELVRLKYITGFAKLWESAEFRKAWEMDKMLRWRQQYYREHPDERDPYIDRRDPTVQQQPAGDRQVG